MSIPADHTGIARFEEQNDTGYTRVLGRLKVWVRDISNTQREADQKTGETTLAAPCTKRTDSGIPISPKLIEFYGDATATSGSVYQGTFASGSDMVFNHG